MSQHTPLEGSQIPLPGLHGGDGPLIARALGLDPASILDLSQSMNPCAPSIESMVRDHLDALKTYPDARDATGALADTFDVDPERVLLTNGGSEAISLVSRELGGRVQSEPEFGLHPRNSTGPLWRSDPHNPSGRLATDDETADVWDEAFYPLATGAWHSGRSSVIVGSLTKVFACPGLRIGYIIADDVDRFSQHQPTWSVNSLAVSVLPDLLEVADLAGWATAITSGRRALSKMLRDHALEPESGAAPWVLVHAPDLRDRLAPLGIIVRDCASFGLPGYVRIAVPDDAGLARLEAGLNAAM